jgi:hypothetical protein
MRNAISSRDRSDLVIKRTQIVVMGWSRVCDVKIEHRHHTRIDTVEKHVAGIGYEQIDFLQLVPTREAGQRKLFLRIWGCIGDIAINNTGMPKGRAVCCHRSGV